jgi:hypothetical protein
MLESPAQDSAVTSLIPLLLALALAPPAPTVAPADAPDPARDEAEAPPTVSIRVQDNGDRVEEYAINGVIYMVKITPARGPAYYLMDTDGNGRLDRDGLDGGVSPVYWTIYEWD